MALPRMAQRSPTASRWPMPTAQGSRSGLRWPMRRLVAAAGSSLADADGSTLPLGSSLADADGSTLPLGSSLADADGSTLPLGSSLADADGSTLPLGSSLADADGSTLAAADGSSLADADGSTLGEADGGAVGAVVAWRGRRLGGRSRRRVRALDGDVQPAVGHSRGLGLVLGLDLGVHVEPVLAEVAARVQMERCLPGLRPDVGEARRAAAGRVAPVDELVGLAELDVVVVVRRQDHPPFNRHHVHVERVRAAVVAAVELGQHGLVGLAGRVHVGQEVLARVVPVPT